MTSPLTSLAGITGLTGPTASSAAGDGSATDAARKALAAGKNGKAARTPEDQKTHKMALEFEGMLVRQMLHNAKIGGDEKSPYAGMAVDSLASGIEAGGGLGMASEIERAIGQHAPRVSGTPAVAATTMEPNSAAASAAERK